VDAHLAGEQDDGLNEGNETTPSATQAAPPPPPRVKPETELERGVRAYLQGATSQPKLASALKISPWEARKLMPEVEAEVKRLQVREQS